MKNKNTKIGLQSGQGIIPQDGAIRIFELGMKKYFYQKAFFSIQKEKDEMENKKMNRKA
jgi:hypothetical protein